MRTPVAVGLLGVSAVGVLTLGLSMAWGDEPGEDFGDAVVATASVNSPADPSETGVETIPPTPTGAPAPTTPVPDPGPATPPPAAQTVVDVPPAGAVEVGGGAGGSGDDDSDDGDDDSDDDSDDTDDNSDDDSDEDDENT